MGAYQIINDPQASEADIKSVDAGLSAFNRQVLQWDKRDDYKALHLLVKSDDGTVMGGLLGGSWWGWMYVSILWVHEDLRGQDVGTQLMNMAAEEGLKRGCHSIFVDTHSFQALPFYQKLGYTVFGELEDFPVGHTRYYLKKRLQSPDAP